MVHTPPPNAESLHGVSVQLYYEGGAERALLGPPRKPLGGWEIEARWVPQWRRAELAPGERVAPEAVERTDVSGVAVFWLEQAGPYEFWTDEQKGSPPPDCWWVGRAQWQGESEEVLLELSVGCT